jgi:hypothetical protein
VDAAASNQNPIKDINKVRITLSERTFNKNGERIVNNTLNIMVNLFTPRDNILLLKTYS